jgi:Tetratricopeptide repeat
MRFRYCLALAVTFCLFTISSYADDQHDHAHFGDMGQVGTVHFPTSCSKAVQPQFERAVAMLHSFWYEEAEKSFRTVADADPHCAMAQWGVAMSLWHPLWPGAPDTDTLKKGQAALLQTRSVPAPTERERDYIAAIATFYEDPEKRDHRTRALAYEKAMQGVAEKYSSDREASIFYALALLATAPPTDKTYANQRKAGAILEKIFAEQPNHPGVAHYIIHSYDNPVLAQQGLAAARSYAKIAPSVPHAQHMPSHIFIRLGLWEEAIASNRASYAAALDYEIKTHMDGPWDQHLHAMDYLEYAYLQIGQVSEARRLVEEANGIIPKKPGTLVAGYSLAAIPARFTIERQRWAEAAALKARNNIGPATEAITWWAKAMGAARTGDLAGAQQDIAQLQALKSKLESSSDPGAKYWAGQVEIQRLSASAWLAHAQGQDEQALASMRTAAEMEDATEKSPTTPGPVLTARELLGDLLMETKQPANALAAYETSLKSSPNRLHSIYGAAQAAEAADRPEIAKRYYAKVVEVCSQCLPDDPSLQRAQRALTMK